MNKRQISGEKLRLIRTRTRKTCRFMECAGKRLGLSRNAIASAMVFFHRYFSKNQFEEHNRFDVAMACLLLASKTEVPTTIKKVVVECHRLRYEGSSSSSLDSKLPEVSFISTKQRVLVLEEKIIYTMGFELFVEHPYDAIENQVKRLVQREKLRLEYVHTEKDKKAMQQNSSNKNKSLTSQQEMFEYLMKHAIMVANNSMYTTLCLHHDAQEISTACVYIGAHACNIHPLYGYTWSKLLGVPIKCTNVFAAIVLRIVDSLAERNKVNKTILKTIKVEINDLCPTLTTQEATLMKKSRTLETQKK